MLNNNILLNSQITYIKDLDNERTNIIKENYRISYQKLKKVFENCKIQYKGTFKSFDNSFNDYDNLINLILDKMFYYPLNHYNINLTNENLIILHKKDLKQFRQHNKNTKFNLELYYISINENYIIFFDLFGSLLDPKNLNILKDFDLTLNN